MTTSDAEPPALREIVEQAANCQCTTSDSQAAWLLGQLAAALLAADERTREAEEARNEAVNLMSEYAAKLGEMEGRYKAAHWPGIVDGWQRRAHTAEAHLAAARDRIATLEGAVRPFAAHGADYLRDDTLPDDTYAYATSYYVGEYRAAARALAPAANPVPGRE